MAPYKTVLVGIDFSEYCREAVRHAIGMVDPDGGRLVLVHVVDMLQPPANRLGAYNVSPTKGFYSEQQDHLKRHLDELDAFAKEYREGELQVITEVAQGNAAKELLHRAYKNQADLIVIGTHGLSRIEKFLIGSVAEKVVRGASCPVLVVKLAAQGKKKK